MTEIESVFAFLFLGGVALGALLGVMLLQWPIRRIRLLWLALVCLLTNIKNNKGVYSGLMIPNTTTLAHIMSNGDWWRWIEPNYSRNMSELKGVLYVLRKGKSVFADLNDYDPGESDTRVLCQCGECQLRRAAVERSQGQQSFKDTIPAQKQ